MQTNIIELFNVIVRKEINVFNNDDTTGNGNTGEDIEMTDDIENEDGPSTPIQSPVTNNILSFNRDKLTRELQNIFPNIEIIKEVPKVNKQTPQQTPQQPVQQSIQSPTTSATATATTPTLVSKLDPIQIEIKNSIDINIRLFFSNLIKQLNTTYENIDLAIKLAYILVDMIGIDPILPLQLSEDLFETKTISECLNLFSLLESRAEDFSQDADIIKGRKRNLLLKMCVELLKRFSRSSNPDSCGRILLFLAYVFPLSDPSGLNTKGEHNIHPEESLDFQNDIMNNIEQQQQDGSGDSGGDSSTTVDRNFYRQFWGLQTVFQNSQQALLNTTGTTVTLNKIKWESFIQSLELVIGSFSTHINLNEISSNQIHHQQINNNNNNSIYINNNNNTATTTTKHYFTKYLTSSNLMKLQLKDSIFRRNILTQILITFQNLELTNQKYPNLFNDLQKNIIQELTIKCFKILSNAQPNGEYYSSCLSSILKREKNWIIWKRDSQCKPFERPACSPIVKRKKLFKKNALTKVSLGNVELSRLWNLSATNDRSYLKTQNPITLETFIDPLKKETIELEAKEKAEASKKERREKNVIRRANASKLHKKEYDDKKAEFIANNKDSKEPYPEYDGLPTEVDSDDLSDMDEPAKLLRDKPVYVWKTLRLISRKKMDLFKHSKFDDVVQSFIVKPAPPVVKVDTSTSTPTLPTPPIMTSTSTSTSTKANANGNTNGNLNTSPTITTTAIATNGTTITKTHPPTLDSIKITSTVKQEEILKTIDSPTATTVTAIITTSTSTSTTTVESQQPMEQ